MRINDDLTRPVVVHAEQLPWNPSPAAGVDRRMLYRIGGEVARATSIVRYAPGSKFPRHTHGGGKEILVLEGVFQDEHGDYPAGTYFRNPPGTSHVPATSTGCTIFVRLWQFRKGDHAQVVRRPAPDRQKPGLCVVFSDADELVTLEEWAADDRIQIANTRGLELLVISGSLHMNGEPLGRLSWARLPAGADLEARTGVGGAWLWIRQAPLMHGDLLDLP